MARPNYSTRLDDQIAVVTGSTRGIGASIARRFGHEGATVIVTGRTEADGEQLAAKIRDDSSEAIFIQADMRDSAAIEALFQTTVEKYSRIDVLVNNAGVQTRTSADEATIEDWEFVVETDFRSYWLCAKNAIKHMNEGNIINISSNHAFLTMPGIFPYNAVKAGINGMTRAMALDFGPQIRVNTINPGWIAIERTESDLSSEEYEYVESIHPLGRIGYPKDVAGVAAFLASKDAAFVTGAEILVDGGRSAVLQDNTLPDYQKRRRNEM